MYVSFYQKLDFQNQNKTSKLFDTTMILYRRKGNNLTIKLKFTQKQLKGQKKK